MTSDKFFNRISETLSTIHDFGLLGPLRIAIVGWMIDRVPWCKRAYTYLAWLASPPASPAMQKELDRICNGCPILKRVGEKRFCGGCGCGQRADAELSRKNSRTRPHCPLGYHPGSIKVIPLGLTPEFHGDGI